MMATSATSSRTPLLARKEKISFRLIVGTVLLCALALCAVAFSQASHQERVQLVQMGVGAEDENDAAIIAALGKADGDISKDVVKETEEAVTKAQKETQEAVDAEIDAAVTKGSDDAKAGYEADIAKYRGQEADMGHTGWVDVYANGGPKAGLKANVAQDSQAHMQQLAVHKARHATAHAYESKA